MVENKQLWDNVLNHIDAEVSKANFSTWFKNTKIIKREDGVVCIGVPNEFVKDWLSNKYHRLILRYLRELSDGVRSVEYVIAQDNAQENQKDSVDSIGLKEVFNNELPLKDLYVDKKDNLNPRYSFENFVIGPFNELAYAATQAVIKSPGITYNPLFIHGGTGLGKTHLIQSVGNYLKNQKLKVLYITSERFLVEYVTAVQNNTASHLKDKYRKYDAFIMDDVQFISGKTKTQEELFHLFNFLYDNNKQIVFSSDKHPNFIPGLEDRLKSRFAAGMTVDISRPEYESRLAILKTKADSLGFSPSDQVLETISSHVEGSVRELEGALNAVICQSRLKNKNLTFEEIRTLIKNNTRPKKSVSIREVIKTVVGFYGIEESMVYEKTRRKEIVKPRQIIMYILREDFNVSYPTIGQNLGGRDHTTVMHSCEKIKNDLKNDTLLIQELDQLRTMM